MTEEARREYFTIVRNMNVTFAEQKKQILEWGKKYGVEVSSPPPLPDWSSVTVWIFLFRTKLRSSTKI